MRLATERLDLRFPAVPETVARARQVVAERAAIAGATREEIAGIRLAVSEAVTNAVVHGGGASEHAIELTMAMAGGELWVLVADRGCGFQTPPQRPGLGWGLPVIALETERFEIAERAEGGTEVRMRFAIGADRGDAAPGSQPAPEPTARISSPR
ncbi:MAG: ATP-binding protein [Solirubrobacteraceae bacterium]